jgi:hypothetical protein
MDEGFRVEVSFDDEEHGTSLRERLRATSVDDQARERLGPGAMVTRDGSTLFVYTATEDAAREAERVARELVDQDGLTAAIGITRWHPIEEEWKDASLPLPTTAADEDAEYAAREAAEADEAAREGVFDWYVAVDLPDRGVAATLEEELRADGLSPHRRWRYVTVGVLTEERAQGLVESLRARLPQDADIRIEVDLSDVTRSPLQFLPF